MERGITNNTMGEGLGGGGMGVDRRLYRREAFSCWQNKKGKKIGI